MPPSSKKLRTTLLDKEKEEVEKLLAPIKSSSVSIFVDGWKDVARHPLINFMVSSQNGPVSLKAVDAFAKYKDVHYMAELFIKVIKEVGVYSCVKIITENVVCKATNINIHKYCRHFPLFNDQSLDLTLNLLLHILHRCKS